MKTFARVISVFLHPLLLATWVVLLFSVINKYAFGAMPVNRIALVIFFNTFFFPAFTIFLMWRIGFIPDMNLKEKGDRTIPFIAAMIFYIWSFMVVRQMQLPVFLQVFVMGATITIFLAFIVNIFYKVSLHMAGMGGILMLLLLVVFTGGIDVANTLALMILLTGLTGTARLVEQSHTLNELYYGLLLGIIGQIFSFILFSKGVTSYI